MAQIPRALKAYQVEKVAQAAQRAKWQSLVSGTEMEAMQ